MSFYVFGQDEVFWPSLPAIGHLYVICCKMGPLGSIRSDVAAAELIAFDSDSVTVELDAVDDAELCKLSKNFDLDFPATRVNDRLVRRTIRERAQDGSVAEVRLSDFLFGRPLA